MKALNLTRITSFNKRQIYPGDLVNYTPGKHKSHKCVFCTQQVVDFTYLALVNRSELKRMRLGRMPTHVYFHKVKCCHDCLRKVSRRYSEGLYIIHDALNYAITRQVNEFTAHLYAEGSLLDNMCAFCLINHGKVRRNVRIPVGVNQFITGPLSVCDTCMNGITHTHKLLKLPKYQFLSKAFKSQSEVKFSTCAKCHGDYPVLDKEIQVRLNTNKIDYACDECALEHYSKYPIYKDRRGFMERFYSTSCTDCGESIVVDLSQYPFLEWEKFGEIKCSNCMSTPLPGPSSISLIIEVKGNPFYKVNVNERDDGNLEVYMYSVFNDNILIAGKEVPFLELYHYLTTKTLNLVQCELNEINIQTVYPNEST